MSYEEYLAAQKAKKAAQSDAFKPLQVGSQPTPPLPPEFCAAG